MANTSNTPKHAAFRKMRVYEAALSEAMERHTLAPGLDQAAPQFSG